MAWHGVLLLPCLFDKKDSYVVTGTALVVWKRRWVFDGLGYKGVRWMDGGMKI